jgi:hypothetical protein
MVNHTTTNAKNIKVPHSITENSPINYSMSSVCVIEKNKTYNLPSKLYMQKSKTDFKVFHQNIRGLVNKVDEILLSLSNTNPQVLCISEHHLESEQICLINLEQYTLGTYYCRKHFKMGGVSIFTLKKINTLK